MTDSELFLIDAQCWFDASEPNVRQIVIDGAKRLVVLECEYGLHADIHGFWMEWNGEAFTRTKHDHAMWFSLLVWADLRYSKRATPAQMEALIKWSEEYTGTNY
jgi:hypothetical protein